MTIRFGDRGSASAEFAVAVPAVVVVLALGVGALQTASVQVRLQDGVADAARMLGRGEDQGRALGMLPEGAQGEIGGTGDLVCVTGRASGPLPGIEVTARSCALGEGG